LKAGVFLYSDVVQGKKELSVSLYQSLVLFLFNDVSRESISYREIKDQTNIGSAYFEKSNDFHHTSLQSSPSRLFACLLVYIEEEELKRTLQSLACGKVRILNKSPKGKDINVDDVFSFNDTLKHPLTRIKVNAIQLKETVSFFFLLPFPSSVLFVQSLIVVVVLQVEEQKDTQERVFSDRQFQVRTSFLSLVLSRKER